MAEPSSTLPDHAERERVTPRASGGWRSSSERRLLVARAGRLVRNFDVVVREGRAILKGTLCRLSCRVRGIRFQAGRNLRIDGRLIIRGPGTVIFGDNVRIGMTVTPWTYDPAAVIFVGDGAFINGTGFGCQREIRIGPKAIIGRASIMDTDFHSLEIDRHRPDAPVRVAPVVLEENVWIGAQAGILPGTRIGRNSVVGFGAVCAGVFPANAVIAGNPARVIKTLTADRNPDT
jgi:acetyltransferase-like isoleucine patch superfamily enzyme